MTTTRTKTKAQRVAMAKRNFHDARPSNQTFYIVQHVHRGHIRLVRELFVYRTDAVADMLRFFGPTEVDALIAGRRVVKVKITEA